MRLLLGLSLLLLACDADPSPEPLVIQLMARNGLPAAGIALELVGDDGKLTMLTTDADGRAQLVSSQPQTLWLHTGSRFVTQSTPAGDVPVDDMLTVVDLRPGDQVIVPYVAQLPSHQVHVTYATPPEGSERVEFSLGCTGHSDLPAEGMDLGVAADCVDAAGQAHGVATAWGPGDALLGYAEASGTSDVVFSSWSRDLALVSVTAGDFEATDVTWDDTTALINSMASELGFVPFSGHVPRAIAGAVFSVEVRKDLDDHRTSLFTTSAAPANITVTTPAMPGCAKLQLAGSTLSWDATCLADAGAEWLEAGGPWAIMVPVRRDHGSTELMPPPDFGTLQQDLDGAHGFVAHDDVEVTGWDAEGVRDLTGSGASKLAHPLQREIWVYD